ncbi:peptidase C14, caspase domain-containing protein [Amanita rubescens]|nr:peptidase C14, caspase domain-containing protein [Amanita rubescens]
MPNPRFISSKCTGKRKALCIGINYLGQRNELKGCVNDALNVRKFLMQNYGFRSSQIMILTDDNRDPRLHPTRQNMIGGMQWLVEGAQPHDSLFIHYSGHGGQKKAEDDEEADGLDEVIFPLDFKKNGDIIDNVQPLPPGCRLTCCHSGTHSAHGRIKKTHISKRARRRDPPPADVICFSACNDDEKSADTFEGGMYVGAMSYVEENPNQTYDQVLESVRNLLRPKYKQKPQLGATNLVDLQAKFIL